MPIQAYTFRALRGINHSHSILLPRGLGDELPTLDASTATNVSFEPDGALRKFIGRSKINASEILDGVPPAAVFTGTGLDDMTLPARDTSVASPTSIVSYRVEITTGGGATNKFRWSDDGGVSWDATDVSITGSAQTLNNGVKIQFGATTGHTLTDRWDWNVGNHQVMGLYEARFKAANHIILASSTELVDISYTSPSWSFTDISGTATLACPNNRRYSFAMLMDTLLIADHRGSSVRKWSGSGAIATLSVTGTGLSTLSAKYLAVYGDILLLANVKEDSTVQDSHIWWTVEGTIDKFTKTSWASVGEDDGDEITGMVVSGRIVIIFKRNSIWKGEWYGEVMTSTMESGFVFEKIISGLGNIAPHSLIQYNGLVYFISYDGVYVFDGITTPKRISNPTLSGYYGDTVPALAEEQAKQIWGFKPHNRNELWFCSQDYPSTTLPTLVYNLNGDQWSQSSLIYNALVNAAATQDLAIGEVDENVSIGDVDAPIESAFYNTLGITMLGGGTTNDVYEVVGGTEDGNGAQIAFTWTSNYTDLGSPGIIKRFLGLRLWMGTVFGNVQHTVEIYIDGRYRDTITLTHPTPLPLVPEPILEHSFNYTGEKILFRIKNSRSGEVMRVKGLQIFYAPMYGRRM